MKRTVARKRNPIFFTMVSFWIVICDGAEWLEIQLPNEEFIKLIENDETFICSLRHSFSVMRQNRVKVH